MEQNPIPQQTDIPPVVENPETPVNGTPVPPPTPTTPEVPKSKTKLMPILLIILILVLLSVGGLYAYKNFIVKPEPAPIPTASSPSTKSVSNTLKIDGSLQDFLKANCKAGNPKYLDVAQLPFTIDFKYPTLKPNSEGHSVYCVSSPDTPESTKDGYIYLSMSNGNMFNIYDDASKEGGHGGPPFLGNFGTEIYKDDNVTITAWLGVGEGPALLGQVGIYIRGERTFTTITGSKIYMNYSAGAIQGNDPRLIEQLKPYTVDSGFDAPEIKYDPTMQENIINHFFAKTPEVNSPESNAIQQVKDVLMGITPK